jgi:hypothetical protein
VRIVRIAKRGLAWRKRRASLHQNKYTAMRYGMLTTSTFFLLSTLWQSTKMQEYQVIGRHLPSEKEPSPKLYRMRIFAKNETIAKSRFWYFVRQLRKMKKATGEIVAVNVVSSAWCIVCCKRLADCRF